MRLAPRRTLAHVGRAAGHLFDDQPGLWFKISSYTCIQHHNAGPDVARQHINGRPAAEKVGHHLRSHFLWKGTHPLGHYPVVTGTGDDDLVSNDGSLLSRDAGDLDRDRFQTAQTARRLGQPILASARRVHGDGVERLNGMDCFL
jgi:hypothetical protein